MVLFGVRNGAMMGHAFLAKSGRTRSNSNSA